MAAGCATAPSDNELEESFKARSKESHFALTPNGQPSLGLGIGLAGGGTRAAATSIGILAGLQEAEVLQRADIVSTVSGAGYGTYWWFSRFLELGGYAGVAAAQADCLPMRYALIAPSGTPNACNARKAPHLAPICVSSMTNFDPQCVPRDDFRYQNYLRGFQDILGPTDFSYKTFYGDNADAARNAVRLLGHSVLAALPNFAANVLFDWQVNVSPSRKMYREGIDSTYGAAPESCEQHPARCDGKRLRQAAPLRRLSELQAARSMGAPEWVINAHAGNGRSGFDLSPPQHAEVTAFEFTPKGFGSSLYNYHAPDSLQEDFGIVDAVAASAAFFTVQQKEVAPPARNLVSLLMLASTVNWGISIDNPNAANTAVKAIHRVLPFPLYYGHAFQAEANSAFINLADGGLTDNLGAYAMLKRKELKVWILSDHSYDRSGRMATICSLNGHLSHLGLAVHIPGLKDLDRVCDEKGKLGYDVFNWRYPILLGCIDVPGAGCKTHRSVRLILLKPALNFHLAETLDPSSTVVAPSDKWRGVTIACKEGLDEPGCGSAVREFGCSNFAFGRVPRREEAAWRFDAPMPCEVIGFLLINGFGRGHTSKDECPGFPQNSSIVMTANSSFSLYGAYRELGRWYARQTRYFIADGKLNEDRFSIVMEQQRLDPMEPGAVSSSGLNFAVSAKAGAHDDCGFLGFTRP